ncbi:MAG: hypothetical protein MUC49_15845 [Raineya sp.]|jgi:DNA-binding MarR family transcriptional regulator|nr:hypothetical protein [Raineya sp.]
MGKKAGRPVKEASYEILDIQVSTKAMKELEINIYEAAILNIIYQYQTQEKTVKGWCMEAKKVIAKDVGITEISLLMYLSKLEQKELIIRSPQALQAQEKYTKYLKIQDIGKKES